MTDTKQALQAAPLMLQSESNDEPPDSVEYDGPSFAEMDPSGRYGRFDEVLGRGACKIVYKAFDVQEGTEVAWNQVRISDLMATKDVAKEDRDRLFAEIRVLKALKHKNIMTFCDSWYNPSTFTVNFITELFTSGTLRQYRKRHKHVDAEVLKRWAWQILCGLVYLHGHNPPIIHRDLKCDNIFINGSDGIVKIGDLGLATMLRSRTAPQSVLGTPEFMAPELYEEEYDDRVDVYSFGMALLELATLEYPYSECANAAQIYRKVSLGVRPAGLQKVTSKELTEFINTCIAPRNQRPRSRQLLKHPYFDTIRQSLATSKSEMSLAQAVVAGEAMPPLHEAPPPSPSLPTAAAQEQAAAAEAVKEEHEHTTTADPAAVDVAINHATRALAEGTWPSSGRPSASNSVSLHEVNPAVEATAATAHTKLPSRSQSDAPCDHMLNDPFDMKADAASHVASALGAMDLLASAVGANSVAGSSPPGSSPPGAATPGQGPSRVASPPGSPLPVGPLSDSGSEKNHDQTAVPGGTPGPGTGPQRTQSINPRRSNECRCAATNRCFGVVGKYREDREKRIFHLRLRIKEPDGSQQTVEFELDMTTDTAASVAAEMVSELELSPEDAEVIAESMHREIAVLSEELEGHASMIMMEAAEALQQELRETALLQASSIDHSMSNSAALGGGSVTGEVLMVGNRTTAPSSLSPPEITSTVRRRSPSPQGAAGADVDASRQQQVQQAILQPALRSMGSMSSITSETSVASAHSSHSIQSSPAQLGSERPSSASVAAASTPTFFRSQSPQLTRSTSIDRVLKQAILPPGRDGGPPLPVLGVERTSSGALSPSSGGILSPSLHQDKRSLSKLFENLQEVAKERGDGSVTPPPNRPPLHPGAVSGLRSAPASLLQDQQQQPRMNGSDMRSVQSGDHGVVNNTVAINGMHNDGSLSPQEVDSASSSMEPPGMLVNGWGTAIMGQTNSSGSIVDLGERNQLPNVEDSAAAAAGGGGGGGVGIGTGTTNGNGLLTATCRRPSFKDELKKEALRKQAADAMKAVELRSLNLLESSIGNGSKNIRGTPMAATRQGSMSATVAGTAAAAAVSGAPHGPSDGHGHGSAHGGTANNSGQAANSNDK